MNLFLAMVVFCGLDVYFLKDSPDLLVRVIPEQGIEQLTLKYSFSGEMWGEMVVEKQGQFYDAKIRTPLDAKIVGLFVVYDDGTVDDKDGNLYLYELSIYPRMLMPFSTADLQVVIAQADKKISSNTHVDEAITLLDYVQGVLNVLPYIPDSPGETRKNMLQEEVDRLNALIGK